MPPSQTTPPTPPSRNTPRTPPSRNTPPTPPSRTTPRAKTAPTLFTRPLAAVLLCTWSGFAGFYLLLPTVPEYAAEAGGQRAAGLVTGLLMSATVAVQPVVPRLLARIGYRAALVVAMALLGGPVPVLVLTGDPVVVAICSLLRGAGFGVFVVAGSAAVAELSPEDRRSRGAGWYGVATGLGGAIGLPFGVLLTHEFGYRVMFVAGAVAPACGLLAALGVIAPRPRRVRRTRVLTGLRQPALLRPFVLLTAGTMAAGTVMTFLPPAAPREPVWLSPAALLVFQLALTGSRWLSGRLGDRFGNRMLLPPAALITAIGALGGTVTGHLPALLVLMLVFGLGFGALQNATLVLMLHRAGRPGFAVAGAQWNLAFDAGLALSGFCVGTVVQYAGYPAGFVAAAAVLLLAVFVALGDVRAGGRDGGGDGRA
ncbi:MFS transporter [Streptomyces sp. NPDC003077]|uniref:MFS transporter n=1 Tax=Streptomyces sp. NPDC003077 TaxID=3154443 RepID=UPI0033AF8FDB